MLRSLAAVPDPSIGDYVRWVLICMLDVQSEIPNGGPVQQLEFE